MPSQLDEILKRLTGDSQTRSSTKQSIPKQFALETLDCFDKLAQKNTKQSWTKSIWNTLKWYVKNKVIPSKSDDEIRADLKPIYTTLMPLFQKLETGNVLKESRKINDESIQKKVEQLPNFKETLQLIESIEYDSKSAPQVGDL